MMNRVHVHINIYKLYNDECSPYNIYKLYEDECSPYYIYKLYDDKCMRKHVTGSTADVINYNII